MVISYADAAFWMILFRNAYRKRRCIVPVDGFFEWKAIKAQKAKQLYAIAMKYGAPSGIAGIWENWKEPSFDLPVLRYRAMTHGIAVPGLAARPYFHRYTDDTIDLCDVLSSHSAHQQK